MDGDIGHRGRLPSTAYFIHSFTGTMQPSDCLCVFCHSSFVVWHTIRLSLALTQVTHNGAHRLSPVDAPLLYCMNGSFRHRPAHASIALPSACVLTSAQATASSHGLGISVLYSHPYSHAVYASQCALPHTTQNSLPMLRLTAYRVGVSNPLCEAPLAGRTA